MNLNLVLKDMLNNVRYGRRDVIRTEDALGLVRDWSFRLPMKYDLLVGVPRSGLMFASFMSNISGIPLSIPEVLPYYWAPQPTKKKEFSSMTTGAINSVLIIEDMTAYGSRILPVQELVKSIFPEITVHIGALYSPVGGMELDTYGAKVDGRSIMEWDMDQRTYANIATDLDGVLCQDCPPGLSESDYVKWMESAIPLRIPHYIIHSIITSRREKYRTITEKWLKENGIDYYRLLMDQSKNDSERDFIGWKVQCVNRLAPDVFIESSPDIAQAVHWKTGIPVICSTTMRMFQK